MARLTYSDIANLPQNHPDYIRFMKENNDLDDAYASASVFDFFCEDEDEDYDDEGSLEHFDRYIAGDR
jgi:hypothetical protein